MRIFVVFLACMLTISCSSGDSQSTVEPTFTVSFTATSIDIATGNSVSINYSIEQSSSFDIDVTLLDVADDINVALNETEQNIQFSAGSSATTGSFSLQFDAAALSFTQQIDYVVSDSGSSGDDGDDDTGTCDTTEDTCNDQDYIIYLPSTHMTIFEGETVTVEIKRNYETSDDIQESFYFNAFNIDGRLSDDGNSLIIEALTAEEDTYGEILAVTEVNGVIRQSRMRLVYYNKNRDLNTDESPQVALLDGNVSVPIEGYVEVPFEIYDPDSDRISYRVIRAPSWVETHVNLTATGMLLTVYGVDLYDDQDTSLLLELSDAHNTGQFEFTLSAANDITEISQHRPEIDIEPSVSVSLIQKFDGDETGDVATLAFYANDSDGDRLSYDIEFSSDEFEHLIQYPYIYLTANDLSELQYEQMTVIAADDNFVSKLTFHLYIKDSFTEFLGGHPNTAPTIETESSVTILETKSVEIPFSISDYEEHGFDSEISVDESLLQAIIVDPNIEVTAFAITGEEDIETEIVLSATDDYGSIGQVTIPVLIEKNSAPVITASQDGETYTEVDLVEGFSVTFDVSVDDVNEEGLVAEFDYDTFPITLVEEDGEVTVTALDIVEDYSGEIIISATDEFGAVGELTLPISISFTNSAPTITASENPVELYPGESTNITLSYADAEGDAITFTQLVDNSYLNFSYDEDTEILTLEVSADSPYEQEYQLQTSASDGFLQSDTFVLVVQVPNEPIAPELEISTYDNAIDEGDRLVVNYTITEPNGDDFTVTIDGSDIDDLTITHQSATIDDPTGTFLIDAPDNVLVDTDFNLTITVTDDSPELLSITGAVDFTVAPVNDPPTVVLDESVIVLTNDDEYSLGLTITDVDNTAHTVEVRDTGDAIVPDEITVIAADVDTILISGASKGTEVSNLPLVVRVYDDDTYTDVSLIVTVVLDNDAPVFDEENQDDLIQMLENSTLDFDLYVSDPDTDTDGDVVTIVSVTSSDEAILTIDGDPDNPDQDTVSVTTSEVTETTSVIVTIIATDGFVQTIKEVEIEITDVP